MPTDHGDVCADPCEGQTHMLTREEREAIHRMPVNVLNLNKWENEAWNAIRHLHPGRQTYTDTRHSALVLDSSYCQALMLKLIRDAAKLRLTS